MITRHNEWDIRETKESNTNLHNRWQKFLVSQIFAGRLSEVSIENIPLILEECTFVVVPLHELHLPARLLLRLLFSMHLRYTSVIVQ